MSPGLGLYCNSGIANGAAMPVACPQVQCNRQYRAIALLHCRHDLWRRADLMRSGVVFQNSKGLAMLGKVCFICGGSGERVPSGTQSYYSLSI